MRRSLVAEAPGRMYAAPALAAPRSSSRLISSAEPVDATATAVRSPASDASSASEADVGEPVRHITPFSASSASERALSEAHAEAQPIPVIPEFRAGGLPWRIRGLVRTLRPNQWAKNFFVIAPIVFAKELTRPSLLAAAGSAFFVFCLLAGAVYTLNDLVDVAADRVHPVKRNRPIASGRVPEPMARTMAVVLVIVSLGGALAINVPFFLVALAYFLQNVAYSFRLKKVAYVDVGLIALGFVLRVLAGGFATRTHVSSYMLACTALLALFLGFGKRRHELASENAAKQRSALKAYTPRALTIALSITGAASVGAYLAYTLDSDTQHFFNTPWLWVTTVHPLFGVVRFLQLVAGSPKAESPTQEMLRDVPFVLNVVLWVIEVIAFVYNVRLA
jgi:decaprenyl-phosphate phosphoribosyltransferase